MRYHNTLERFHELSYPVTTDEVIEQLGETQVEFVEGSETVAEVFERAVPETFEHPDELQLTFMSALSGSAVGRKGYSDRDPPTSTSREMISF